MTDTDEEQSADQDVNNIATHVELPVPTKENDWLGFCQSAVKLQNGDRKVSFTPPIHNVRL